jgi:xanthine dehydrogenase accessory factor
MTHNFARDCQILRALPPRLRYLGVLGPRRRTDELLTEIGAGEALQQVYAPVGLDLGAETPEEIALAILAEIQAVLRSATSRSLRDRPGPIHINTLTDSEAPRATPANPWGSACSM